jgi:hypothetical protein
MNSNLKKIRLAFEQECIQIPLANLCASKALLPTIKDSQKYQQIKQSIGVIGLVEPLVVMRDINENNKFLVLDGHLRLEALIELNIEHVLCLLSKDDEAFTYNKNVNRLSAVQEHHMIVKANESGVAAEALGKALGLSEVSIKQRFKLLNGICDEAISLLADKSVPRKVFPILKAMKPFRQIDVANVMINLNNYSVKFANAMLQGTPADQLLQNKRGRTKNGSVLESLQRLERELATVQEDTKLIEETYGPANLQLTIIKTHIISLLDNARIVKWLLKNNPEYLEQLQLIGEQGKA